MMIHTHLEVGLDRVRCRIVNDDKASVRISKEEDERLLCKGRDLRCLERIERTIEETLPTRHLLEHLAQIHQPLRRGARSDVHRSRISRPRGEGGDGVGRGHAEAEVVEVCTYEGTPRDLAKRLQTLRELLERVGERPAVNRRVRQHGGECGVVELESVEDGEHLERGLGLHTHRVHTLAPRCDHRRRLALRHGHELQHLVRRDGNERVGGGLGERGLHVLATLTVAVLARTTREERVHRQRAPTAGLLRTPTYRRTSARRGLVHS